METAKEIIDRVKDGEQTKFDNLSEGLQVAANGQQLETGVETLDDVLTNIDDAMEGLNNAINKTE